MRLLPFRLGLFFSWRLLHPSDQHLHHKGKGAEIDDNRHNDIDDFR